APMTRFFAIATMSDRREGIGDRKDLVLWAASPLPPFTRRVMAPPLARRLSSLRSYSDRCLDRGMRVVILEREVLKLEVEEILHRRVQPQGWQLARLAR